MRSDLLRTLLIALLLFMGMRAADAASSSPLQEEIWALRFDLPTLASVVHPVGKGPFPTSASLEQFAADHKGAQPKPYELPDDEQ